MYYTNDYRQLLAHLSQRIFQLKYTAKIWRLMQKQWLVFIYTENDTLSTFWLLLRCKTRYSVWCVCVLCWDCVCNNKPVPHMGQQPVRVRLASASHTHTHTHHQMIVYVNSRTRSGAFTFARWTDGETKINGGCAIVAVAVVVVSTGCALCAFPAKCITPQAFLVVCPFIVHTCANLASAVL